jgi:hypothetical protein
MFFQRSSTVYNPFLYAWLNDNFHKEFRSVIPFVFKLFDWCRQLRPNGNQNNNNDEFDDEENRDPGKFVQNQFLMTSFPVVAKQSNQIEQSTCVDYLSNKCSTANSSPVQNGEKSEITEFVVPTVMQAHKQQHNVRNDKYVVVVDENQSLLHKNVLVNSEAYQRKN